jgi:DNA-binding beta-propeller fold protein YncE
MKKARAFLVTLLLFSSLCFSSAAEVPYTGYSYDEWDVAIPSTTGYLPTETYYGDAELTTRFKAPEDMFVADDGTIYVLDTGNNRVVILNEQFELIKILDKFKLSDGTNYSLSTPKGIFVRDGLLYIADYENMNVIVSDIDGNIRLRLIKPESQTFPQASEFRPQKVLTDSEGRIYVLVLGVYQGAAVFNAEGEFVDFFGSNTVIPTFSVLMDRFWKRLMSDEQQSQIANYVPVEFTGFDITEDNFVYTCTDTNSSGISELRHINPMGENIWSGNSQGDLEIGRNKNKSYYSMFIDVAITKNHFLFAMDSTKGRIFMYDPEGNMVFVFGGKGTQVGTFTQPSAIDTYGDKVLVLDSIKRSITIFKPTEYGALVNQALTLYVDGNFDASKDIWKEVLKQDGNLYTAYIGIGKALYYSGNYKESIDYFRKGYDRSDESKAFKEYRSALLRVYFPYIMTGGFSLIVLLFVWRFLLKRRKKRKGGSHHE